jgi:phage repressor protein C with HTH and peptisase S24 domain
MMGTSLTENGEIFLNGHVADYLKRPHALLHRQRLFGLYVASAEMEPAYYDGDPIIVDPDRPPTSGEDVLIEMKPAAVGTSGICYLRKLVKRNPTNLIVKQHNPSEEFRLATKDIANVYRVLTRRELLGV